MSFSTSPLGSAEIEPLSGSTQRSSGTGHDICLGFFFIINLALLRLSGMVDKMDETCAALTV